MFSSPEAQLKPLLDTIFRKKKRNLIAESLEKSVLHLTTLIIIYLRTPDIVKREVTKVERTKKKPIIK